MREKEMDHRDCLQKLREIRDCAMATVDEKGNPQVRIIDVMLVESDCLIFCTARGKDFYHQLMLNKKVAVTGLTKDFQSIRVFGSVEKMDPARYWIDRIFEENPSMKNVYPKDTRYILEPFCVRHAKIEYFDLSQRPIHRISLAMGKETERVAGFMITAQCIGCGTCLDVCPQSAIDEGVPCKIRQENCLHCGNCYENCPVQAIIKREG